VDGVFHRAITAGAGKAVGKIDQGCQAFADVAHVFDDGCFDDVCLSCFHY
jgi:hypothetical protein